MIETLIPDEIRKALHIANFPGEKQRWDVCGDRACGAWRKFDDSRRPVPGTPGVIQLGLLWNVTFDNVYQSHGCGGEYTGHAQGLLLMNTALPAELEEYGRHLWFDNCDGIFWDRENHEALEHVDLLVLKPNLHALYFPS